MEFAWRCIACGITEAWTTEAASVLSAAHHALEHHPSETTPSEWIDGLPAPDEFGRRFEEWERQS